MRIHSVRLGLATNSSSTHSLIFLRRPVRCDATGEFGWDFWTAASPEMKRRYFAATLYSNLLEATGPEIAALVAAQVADVRGVKWERESDATTHHDYIDHQSLIALPRAWDGKGVDLDFAREFGAFLLSDDVAILGGNDNDTDRHPIDNGTHGPAFRLALPLEIGNAPLVARKDSRGFWTVFNRVSGAKVRFSWDAPTGWNPDRTDTPELVDVKITDFCPIGCEFCYQGSTKDGQHADARKIGSLAWALSKMRVFEVAIGGGEPTMHPQFADILATFRGYGVVPNFTTRSLAWFRDPAIASAVRDHAGAFAFSVQSPEDVEQWITSARAAGFENPSRHLDYDYRKISAQYVMGSTDLPTFTAILKAATEADLRLTLLGYKRTGRGETFQPHPYEGWIGTVKDVRASIGIDTALAAESLVDLKAAGIPAWQYHVREGRFSMYVDAVARAVGPSSYDPSAMVSLADQFADEATLRRTFAAFG